MALLPTVTMEGITIVNSTNANFQFQGLDTVTLKNIRLYNTSFSQTDIHFPMFHFEQMNRVVISDLKAVTLNGPVFRFSGVLNHQISDCNFEDISTSQEFPAMFQNLLILSRDSSNTRGLNKKTALQTKITGFNVNVFYPSVSILSL